LGDIIKNICFKKAAGVNYNGRKCAMELFISLTAHRLIFFGCSNEGG
jgi:hypothetical protein